MYSLIQVLGYVLKFEHKGTPYIFIPFILCNISILLYYVRYRISLGSQIARISSSISLTISLHNKSKNLKFKAFVANFIILLLFLESLINLMRSIFYFIPIPEIFPIYNLTESCQINNTTPLIALLRPQYWFFFLPFSLSPSLHLCILPIVTLLISVLINIFLDRPYKKRIKIGLGIIFCRFFVSVCLLSIFQTRILFYIPYMCLSASDYFKYLYYARVFHQLLCSRRNESRIHRREDPQLFRERSYVLCQYRVTTLYTICVLSVYLFFVFVSKISTFISILTIDSCYFSYITGGYIPTLQLSFNSQIFTLSVFQGVYCISILSLYLYQLLLFVAYFAVCVAIVVKHLINLTEQKKAQCHVAQIVDRYHRDFPTYRD